MTPPPSDRHPASTTDVPRPELVVGPLLRFVSSKAATVWVQTDRPCVVEVLGRSSRTFSIEGHHFALVVVDGLEAGRSYPYRVALDGEEIWPRPGPWPPSVIRTHDPRGPIRVAIGSCRVGAPLDPPWSDDVDAPSQGLETDALDALARHVAPDPTSLPDLMLLVGDQIYADRPSPATLAHIRSRRPSGTEAGDFEDYAFAYKDSWTAPSVRWLLSTVPTMMIFDDHEVDNGWNSSQAWVDAAAKHGAWPTRITGALGAYWVYQHLGNLAPDQLAADETGVLAAGGGDLTAAVTSLARRSAGLDQDGPAPQWSYSRDVGPVRIVVVDSRATRVLNEGHRSMLTPSGWRWLEAQLSGTGPRHLMLVTSVPVMLPTFVDRLEAWSDRAGAGAWGRPGRALAGWLRTRLGLEHWPAYGDSAQRLLDMLVDLAAGRRGPAPASVLVASGEVHYSYLAERVPPSGARIIQIVSSPLRNPSPRALRAMQRVSATTVAAQLGRAAARLSGAPPARHRWQGVGGPWFRNLIAIVELNGREARIRMDRTVAPRQGVGLTTVHEVTL